MFNKFLDQFKQLGKSDKTIQNYVSTWNAFEKWTKQGNPYLKDAGYATLKNISDYKRYMLQEGGRYGQTAKPSTMQLAFVQLNAIFGFFAEKGYEVSIFLFSYWAQRRYVY